MMRKIALIALLLVTCIGGAALAQEATPQFCGTLSDADCAILTQSQQAMAALDSASFAVEVNATVSNVEGVKEPITIGITGNGSYGGLSSIRSDVLAAQGDTAQLLTSLLTNLNADFSMTFTLPPEITAQAGNIPSSITVQERLVDGIGYVNLDTLQALMGSGRGASAPKGWYGLDLVNFFKEMLAQQPNMFNNPMGGSMEMMQEYQKAFGDPAFLNRFMKIERTDDGSTSTATFDITLNMGTLMGSPEFQDMMRQQMRAQNSSMTSAQIDQALAMSAQMFKGMDIRLSEEINIDDGYLHKLSGSFSFDGSGMMATMAQNGARGSSSSAGKAAPQISVDFSYTYSDFNSAPAITAPPNAIIVPYQSLLHNAVSA